VGLDIRVHINGLRGRAGGAEADRADYCQAGNRELAHSCRHSATPLLLVATLRKTSSRMVVPGSDQVCFGSVIFVVTGSAIGCEANPLSATQHLSRGVKRSRSSLPDPLWKVVSADRR